MTRGRGFQKRHPPPGSRPGSIVIPAGSPAPRITVVHYDQNDATEEQVEDLDQLVQYRDRPGVTWIDVQGLGDERTLRRIAELFGMHPLALEDVVNIPQRPKLEPFPDHDLIITSMIAMPSAPTLDIEQLGLVLGRGWLLTFQERYDDVLDPVRERIWQGIGPLRKSGADYLAYAIVDAIIDAYYPVLEGMGEHLDTLETRVLKNPTPALLARIHEAKRTLLTLRRVVWPQREMVNTIVRDGGGFVTDPVRVYFRDCYDHVIQVIDVIESYREIAGGLLDVHLATVSNRMNEVMKVLTIMASIFIPLTFIAGIYGMNFEYMPELQTRWAYPMIWLTMLGVAGGMYLYFRRRGWIGGGDGDDDEDEELPP